MKPRTRRAGEPTALITDKMIAHVLVSNPIDRPKSGPKARGEFSPVAFVSPATTMKYRIGSFSSFKGRNRLLWAVFLAGGVTLARVSPTSRFTTAKILRVQRIPIF